jgi:hypothetical protein
MAGRDVSCNDDDWPMRISQGSRTMTFDRFECAIDLHPNVRTAAAAKYRPKGNMYCGTHCAKSEGIHGCQRSRGVTQGLP